MQRLVARHGIRHGREIDGNFVHAFAGFNIGLEPFTFYGFALV